MAIWYLWKYPGMLASDARLSQGRGGGMMELRWQPNWGCCLSGVKKYPRNKQNRKTAGRFFGNDCYSFWHYTWFGMAWTDIFSGGNHRVDAGSEDRSCTTGEATICAYNNREPWIVIVVFLQLGSDNWCEMWRIWWQVDCFWWLDII